MFQVWISRTDGATRLRVDGLENTNWLLAQLSPQIHGEDSKRSPILLLSQTRVLLEHLETIGQARRQSDGELEYWSPA